MRSTRAFSSGDGELRREKEERVTVVQEKEKIQFIPGTRKTKAGWVLIGSLADGLIEESKSDTSNDRENKSGHATMGRLLLSYYAKDVLGEFGVGFASHLLTGKESVTRENQVTRENVVVRTQTGMFDVGVRWRPYNRWEIGPVVSTMFGGDLSFSSSEVGSKTGVMTGIQGGYGYWGSTQVVRLKGEILTDLTVPDKRLTWYLLSVDIGFPFVGYDRFVKTKDVVAEKYSYTRVEKKAKSKRHLVRFPFDQAMFQFASNSSALTLRSEQFARLLAVTFFDHAPGFEAVVIKFVPRTETQDEDLYRRRIAAVLEAISKKVTRIFDDDALLDPPESLLAKILYATNGKSSVKPSADSLAFELRFVFLADDEILKFDLEYWKNYFIKAPPCLKQKECGQ